MRWYGTPGTITIYVCTVRRRWWPIAVAFKGPCESQNDYRRICAEWRRQLGDYYGGAMWRER